jgi:hypothetical protein
MSKKVLGACSRCSKSICCRPMLRCKMARLMPRVGDWVLLFGARSVFGRTRSPACAIRPTQIARCAFDLFFFLSWCFRPLICFTFSAHCRGIVTAYVIGWLMRVVPSIFYSGIRMRVWARVTQRRTQIRGFPVEVTPLLLL